MKGWLAAIGVGLAGAIAFLLQALKAKQLEGDLKAANLHLDAQEKRVKELEGKLTQEMGDHATDVKLLNEQKARLETVITGLKADLNLMSDQLATCTDPEVIRTRLNSLFPEEPK